MALEADPAGLNRPRPYNRRRCPSTSRSCSARTSSSRSASSCRRSCCRSPCGPGARRSNRRTGWSDRCCGPRRTARIAIGIGLALTGIGLVLTIGSGLFQQPWLLVALTIYFVNLGIAFFIQRPNLRRLIGIRAAAGRQDVARSSQAPALRVVPDGRPGRDDRVPDELEAGAVVTPRDDVAGPPVGCLFCRIADGSVPADLLHEDDLVIAFRDIAPRAPTHILLIPRRHIRSALELTEADGPLLGRLFAVAADLARSEGIADGGYPAGLERRSLGRPDRRPPPLPPDGWATVRLAARMRVRIRRSRRSRSPWAQRSSWSAAGRTTCPVGAFPSSRSDPA